MSYPVRSGRLAALHNLSCTIAAGTCVALVGPSGCGKTTLLRTIGGLLAPDTGTIQVGNQTPDQARRARQVSFLFQQPVLLSWKTALHNVELPLRLAGHPRHERRERARHMLELVGLSDVAHAYPHQLSGGMKQRVALARALSLQPALFLMDEPFSAVDALTRERLNIELLRLWAGTGATMVFVTHALSEAVFLADRVLVLSERPGTVVADVAVPLPRPRTPALFEQHDFVQCVATLRRALAGSGGVV